MGVCVCSIDRLGYSLEWAPKVLMAPGEMTAHFWLRLGSPCDQQVVFSVARITEVADHPLKNVVRKIGISLYLLELSKAFSNEKDLQGTLQELTMSWTWVLEITTLTFYHLAIRMPLLMGGYLEEETSLLCLSYLYTFLRFNLVFTEQTHLNFDGDDVLQELVRIKFTPNWVDFTLWFQWNMVKTEEIKKRGILLRPSADISGNHWNTQYRNRKNWNNLLRGGFVTLSWPEKGSTCSIRYLLK